MLHSRTETEGGEYTEDETGHSCSWRSLKEKDENDTDW